MLNKHMYCHLLINKRQIWINFINWQKSLKTSLLINYIFMSSFTISYYLFCCIFCPWYIKLPTHGILNPPYPWYIDPLPMEYWLPYPWYIDPPIHGILTPLTMVYQPPTHGILTPYPWYINLTIHGILTPLPMVYQTPYPWYIKPPSMVFWTHYPWYFDPMIE
jgi:hypothetical protein